MVRKRISIVSIEEKAFIALANDEDGGDYAALLALAQLVLGGKPIDPDFQKVVNAIVVQALLFDRLPPKKKGRPKNKEGIDGYGVAARYFSLRDAGIGYADSVAHVAANFHKDERHIMRLVRENKDLIGRTKAERERRRAWYQLCADMEASIVASGGKPARQSMLEFHEKELARESERDLVAELDAMIEEVLNRRTTTDTK